MTEAFPTTADEFYAKRDDRTNQCTSQREYQTVGCVITADDDALSTPSGRTLLDTSCNLLARWCRRVEIVTQGQDRETCDGVLAQMRDADPFGAFSTVTKPTGACQLQLHIGSNPSEVAKALVAITSTGWLATLATNVVPPHSIRCDGNVTGAIAAACLAGTQLFKLAIGTDPAMLVRDGTFDTLSMQWTQANTSGMRPATNNIGRVLLVGAGSVGSAAAHWIKTIGLHLDLQIIEADTVKVENFNRSPVFGKANYGMNKARALKEHLRGTSAVVMNTVEAWWHEAIQEQGRPEADIWLPLANDFNVRWSMQNNLPPLIIHASTGKNWLANFGRHIPNHDDCLADRFPNDAHDEALTCSIGPITRTTETVDAALPFLSFFAGLLVAADLARLTMPGYPSTPNYAAFDFGSTMSTIQQWDRKPQPQCVCTTQTRQLHEHVNGRTRYADLFRRP
jgi:hypothetical protein